ncbi:hypothetical protein GDO86_005228 [Hymenochirus boettgeri]|uniref:RING-type domain-containing protein n=1 Tax=Hymenochirus boettgeri TaxID=247094 RepID=A0A8T2J5C0_9PIPI|nr:hypothetical protein GDO86_005228 [Hymenochirus boettgeri]
MADPVPEESSLAEELTCSVCCDLLNDPVMLDCMHHFCRACILRFWDSSHRVSDCPYCRKVMPNRFVRTNHLLQKVVDLVRKNSRPEYHNNIQKNLKEMLEARENLMKTLEQQKEKAENKICNVEVHGTLLSSGII